MEFTEQDEREAADFTLDYAQQQAILNDGTPPSAITRSETGRWLVVADQKTYDLTDAVRYQARRIAKSKRPLGY